MSGGNFLFNLSGTPPGIWSNIGAGGVSSSAPAGAADTYGYTGGVGVSVRTVNLGGNFSELISGARFYFGSLVNNQDIIRFYDSTASPQCDVRMNGSGQLFFTRNGTVIGGTSTASLPVNSWIYIEFHAIFGLSNNGTCEVKVNGITYLTVTGVTNATGSAAAAMTQFDCNGGSWIRDFYTLDTGTGDNTTYLGDIAIVELFPDGAGFSSAWTPNVGPFTLTSVNGSGVYQGTITGGGSNAYVGYNFNITGFTNGANNVTGGVCTASSTTSITITATTVTETHAGSAAFQCMVQSGINKTGTRPNGDVAYIASNTTGASSDFAHQALILSGSIKAVVHLTYARKDDAGTRQISQICVSGGTTELSSTISLGNTYQYYKDILEEDPNTGSQWTVAGLNAATFGVEDIS